METDRRIILISQSTRCVGMEWLQLAEIVSRCVGMEWLQLAEIVSSGWFFE
jgi:hypothetical protein